MRERVLNDGIFISPNSWSELNADKAKDATQIVICADGQNVGVYYSEKECSCLTDEEEYEICELAKQYGFGKCRLYGLVEADLLEKLNIKNVGNAMLFKN